LDESLSYNNKNIRIESNDQTVKLILILLHHFYYLEHSELKYYLINLPYYTKGPIYNFDSDENQLIKGEQTFEMIKEE